MTLPPAAYSVVLFGEYTLGHVLAKCTPFTVKNIRKAVERNGGCYRFILDWKGTLKRTTRSKRKKNRKDKNNFLKKGVVSSVKCLKCK